MSELLIFVHTQPSYYLQDKATGVAFPRRWYDLLGGAMGALSVTIGMCLM